MPRTPLWTPTPDRVATTGMDTFRRRVAATRPELVDSVALHRWSIEHQGEFHEALWDFAGVIGEPGSVAFDAGDGSVRGGRFFPQSHVSMAENLLAHRDGANDDAIVAITELGDRRVYSWTQLRSEVAALAAALAADGVQPDRKSTRLNFSHT